MTPFICLMLSSQLKAHVSHGSVISSFETYEAKALELPDNAVPPYAEFLAAHRQRFQIA
jgi:hypothetical protein